MAIFVRTQTNATWTTGNYTPTRDDWESLDAKCFAGINGDKGGVWAPSSVITFTDRLRVTGRTLILNGGRITFASTSNGIKLGTNEWPSYATGHALETREILQLFLNRQSATQYLWVTEAELTSIRAMALGIQRSDTGSVTTPAPFRVPLKVQDGATLTQAIFTFRVQNLNAQAPYSMPAFRLVRINKDGAPEYLRGALSSNIDEIATDVNGWASVPTVTDPIQWFNDALAQTFTYTCTQNNIIDVSLYTYYAEVREEGVSSVFRTSFLVDGNLVREEKLEVDCATTTLNNFGAYATSIDGVLLDANTRVLVKNDGHTIGSTFPDNTLNGIYLATSPDWTRVADLSSPAHFTSKFFVRVKRGNTNAGTIWTCFSAPTKVAIAYLAVGDPIIFTQNALPGGNKYHSVKTKFTNITQMRFQ